MKWFIICVLIVAGLAKAEENDEKRGVLRRATRQAIGNMGGAFLVQTEKNIIHNCKVNGLDSAGASKLQQTYDEMKRCMANTRIFSVPKAEYIDKMVTCSRQAVSQTKDCLSDKQKYFPEFILDLSKSLVSFMYDDKSILSSPDLPRCMNNFIRSEVQYSYISCMTNVATRTHDDEFIPNSKADFCGKFLPAGECFPKILNQYCDKTANVVKFTTDYQKSLEQPCDTKEH